MAQLPFREPPTIRVDELDFDLPPDRIAQHPVSPRDSSRLMIVNRATGSIEHAHFRDLPASLRPGDCLVLNQTRVIPARFHARRTTGGKLSGLFLDETGRGRWRVLLTSGGRLKHGETLSFDRGKWQIAIVGRGDDGEFDVSISPADPAGQILAVVGHPPLPPYIKRSAETGYAEDLRDRLDYQTVYARDPGAVAAPTAGLHFTPELLDRIAAAGVNTAHVTLHVGRGTFQPVAVEDLAQHPMHSEPYDMSAAAAAAINAARPAGGRIVAVGTTAVRVLESCAVDPGPVAARSGTTKLLIQPPYQFRAVDALITNFHLPRSTLLALVFAFAGEKLSKRAYAAALDQGYRFFSFGDAMLIV